MRTVADPKRVRTYRVAGADGFYPDNPVTLTQRVAKFFASTKRETLPGPIAGLVCPHAGYDYSGAIAAAEPGWSAVCLTRVRQHWAVRVEQGIRRRQRGRPARESNREREAKAA